jgi:hypothetical protein
MRNSLTRRCGEVVTTPPIRYSAGAAQPNRMTLPAAS